MVLSGMFNAEPNLEVVDSAQSQEELIFKSVTCSPDIIISHTALSKGNVLPLYTSVYLEEDSLDLLFSEEMARKTNPLNRKLKSTGALNSIRSLDPIPVIKCAATRILIKVKEFLEKCIPEPESLPKYNKPAPAFLSFASEEKLNLPFVIEADPLCVITVGASTGGSIAVEYLIRDLNIIKPTVIVVAVHMPNRFTKRLAERLQKVTNWTVQEAVTGMLLQDKMIVIAPGGCNTLIRKKSFGSSQLYIELEKSSGYNSPCIDSLFQSASFCAKKQVLGVIMTGLGNDGTVGALEIRNKGGVVIAQDKETSSIFGMAKSAIESGAVNGVFALGQLTSVMSRFVMDRNMSQVLQTAGVGWKQGNKSTKKSLSRKR